MRRALFLFPLIAAFSAVMLSSAHAQTPTARPTGVLAEQARLARVARDIQPTRLAVPPGRALRSTNVTPVTVSKVIEGQTDEQRASIAASILAEIERLRKQLDERLAEVPKTGDTLSEIVELNNALEAKQQALDLALGKPGAVTNAAAESFLNASNPYFLMCGQTFWARDDPTKWLDQFVSARPALIQLGRSVGAIQENEVLRGTGFAIGRGLLLTNAHVLRIIGNFDPQKKLWRIRQGVRVAFDLEYKLGADAQCDKPHQTRHYTISAVVFAGSDASNMQVRDENLIEDLAVLLTTSDAEFPAPVRLVTRPPDSFIRKMVLAVIGYPEAPRDMTIAERMQFFSGPDTLVPVVPFKRLSPGFAADLAPNAEGYFPHLVNTAGGNSGSPIIDLADGAVVGIHVRGEDRSLATAKNWGIAGERIQGLLTKAGIPMQ